MESNEMQQSKNIKAFFQAFAQFLEATSNFKNFEKKDYPSSYVFSKLQTVKGMVRQSSK